MTAVIFFGFARFPPLISPLPLFVLFMLASSFRNVSCNTLTTKVPRADERASFASVQSAVQHMAAACGAFSASRILSETESHELIGMERVATISILVSFALPPLLFIIERGVRARAAAAPHEPELSVPPALPASGSSALPPHEGQ
jgi:predicted MFS family arabinose efflux permease